MPLDNFSFEKVGIQNYKKLSYIVRVIFVLSHGQASVERGFSVNDSVIDTNMSPESVIFQRLIWDHMISNDLKPATVRINKSLVLSVKSTNLKWNTHMAEKKSQQEKCDTERHKEVLTSVIKDINSKIVKIEHIRNPVKC